MHNEINERTAPANAREYIASMKETLGVVKWIWLDLIKSDARKSGIIMVLFFLVAAVLSLGNAYAVKLMFDGMHMHVVGTAGAFETVRLGIIIAIVLGIFAQLFHFLEGREREYFEYLFRWQADSKIMSSFFNKTTGQLMRESTHFNPSSIEKARGRLGMVAEIVLFNIIPSGTMLVAAMFLLLITNWVVFSIALLGVIIFAVIVLHLNKSVLLHWAPRETEERAINRMRNERLRNAAIVKISTNDERDLSQIDGRTERYNFFGFKFWSSYILKAIIRSYMMQIIVLASVGYAVYGVFGGYWGIGLVYPVMRWSQEINNHLRNIGHGERLINQHIQSVKTLKEMVEIAPDFDENRGTGVKVTKEKAPRIEFKNVSFSHAEGTFENESGDGDLVHTIQNVSFTIESGQKVALIGPSGAGKSTIMQLLLRSYDPDDGQILVNGQDLRELDLVSWRKVIGYVPQKPFILNGSVRENILYGRNGTPAPSEDELWNYVRDMHVDFPGRLTKGLETQVGEHGIKISGGEAQRISVLNALLREPHMLAIDEATSSLDAETERLVQDGIEKILHKKDVSGLVIAHRLCTIKNCDKVVVLKQSSELDPGDSQIEYIASTFEELNQHSAIFARSAQLQGIAI